MIILLLLAVCFLAYSNDTNDNFKGVASLFGSKTTGYRTAIGWTMASTFAGSMAAMFLAQSLLTKFSGKGLVPVSLVGSGYFFAVATGAEFTTTLATFTGFPIYTTHALTGAMMGNDCVAVRSQVNLSVLGKAFFMPLLLSPVLALAERIALPDVSVFSRHQVCLDTKLFILSPLFLPITSMNSSTPKQLKTTRHRSIMQASSGSQQGVGVVAKLLTQNISIYLLLHILRISTKISINGVNHYV